jgi:hypothetical protein
VTAFYELLERVTAQRDALAGAVDALWSLRGTAVSDDGMCAADVDHTGALVALRLDEAATRRPPAEIGALIVATAAAAAENAAARRAALLTVLTDALTARTG